MLTIYEAVGGIEGLKRLAHAWHHRVLEDEVTKARRAVDEARIQLRRAEIRQRRTADTLRRLER